MFTFHRVVGLICLRPDTLNVFKTEGFVSKNQKEQPGPQFQGFTGTFFVFTQLGSCTEDGHIYDRSTFPHV